MNIPNELDSYIDAAVDGRGSANVLLYPARALTRVPVAIIRAALALANDRDGGCIVIGPLDTRRENPGMQLDEMINDHASPSLRMTLFTREHPVHGRYLLVNVASVWGDVQYPAICLRSRGRTLTRMGIYVLDRRRRDVKMVSTVEDFREIIQIACDLDAARLRGMINRVRSPRLEDNPAFKVTSIATLATPV